MPSSTVRSANSVSRALSSRGIPVGYRYSDFGYRTRDGLPITEPGCDVTRNKRARYGGQEDRGYVGVFLINPDGRDDPAFADRVEVALVDAGLPYVRVGSTSFEVLDPADAPDPDDTTPAGILRQHLATLPATHRERAGLLRAIEILRHADIS